MSVSATINDVWTEFVTTRRTELRNELIAEYAPLVRFVVGRLFIPQTSFLEANDLISYGTIGLITAIDRFDPSRGIRFETFATARIRGAVIDQLRSLNWLSRSMVARIRQVESTQARLEQQLRRLPTEDEMAAELHVTVARYRRMLSEVNVNVQSLDAPMAYLLPDEPVSSLGDLLVDYANPGPAECLELRELIAALATAIDLLPERERLVLSLYYQEELTMKDISKVLEVSESRVCQLHIQAVIRLRVMLKEYHDVDRCGTPARSRKRHMQPNMHNV